LSAVKAAMRILAALMRATGRRPTNLYGPDPNRLI
jgi:hypothetical protein